MKDYLEYEKLEALARVFYLPARAKRSGDIISIIADKRVKHINKQE